MLVRGALGSLLCIVAVLLVSVAWADRAHAQLADQPSQSDEQAAQQLFREGLEHARTGRWGEAVHAFERSRAMHERPSVLQNLAFALERVGRDSAALLTVARYLEVTGDTGPASTREELLALKQKLEQRVAVLRLETVPAHAQVQLDGVTQAADAQGHVLVLDPGKHVLSVSHEGYRTRVVDVFAASGARLSDRVELVLVPTDVQASPELGSGPTVEAAREPPRSQRRGSQLRGWAWGVGGGAVALGALGVSSWLVAGARGDCGASGCTEARADQVRRLDWVANIAVPTAALAALTSGALFWTARKRERGLTRVALLPPGLMLQRQF